MSIVAFFVIAGIVVAIVIVVVADVEIDGRRGSNTLRRFVESSVERRGRKCSVALVGRHCVPVLV